MDEAPLQILTDVLVIVSGSLLWRQELKNRAESLLVIWEKARRREGEPDARRGWPGGHAVDLAHAQEPQDAGG